MSALDIFAWIVLVILVVSAVTLWVVLARLPGRIATQRGHPYKDAVTVAGWLGAVFAGILWPLALIWAFATRNEASSAERRR